MGRLSFILLLFSALPPLLWGSYRENPYAVVQNGAESQALGGAYASGWLGPDGLFQNPASLVAYRQNYFTYEFDTEIRFRGIRTDYRMRFDLLSSLGLLLKTPDGGHLGLSFFNLFRGSGNREQVGVWPFVVRKLGFSHAWALRDNLVVGANVGPVLATENGRWALFGHGQFGLYWKPVDTLTLGTYVSTPAWFEYRIFSGSDVAESTPFMAVLGVGWEVSPMVRLMAEVRYEGWDSVVYRESGLEQSLAQGDGAFDIGQNLFMSFGIFLQSDGGKREALVRDRAAKDRIARLRTEIEELSRDPAVDSAREKQVEARLAQNRLGDRLYELDNRILTREEEKVLREEARAYGKKYAEYRAALTAVSNVRLLVGARDEMERRMKKADALKAELDGMDARQRQARVKVRTPAEEAERLEVVSALSANSNAMATARQAEIQARESRTKRLQVAEAKARTGEYLNPEEDLLLSREQAAGAKRQEMARLEAEVNRPQLKSPPRGEYYLGFNPEVAYQTDGTFLKMGSITGGFSFRPDGVDSLRFHVSFTDKSLFRLIGLFPDNDLFETVKVGAEWRF